MFKNVYIQIYNEIKLDKIKDEIKLLLSFNTEKNSTMKHNLASSQ